MNEKNIKIITIFLILTLSFMIRINSFNLMLYDDETAEAAITNILLNNFSNYNSDNIPRALVYQQPPFSILLRAIAVKFFGLNAASLRGISLLFGILTILVGYFLANELYDQKVATISALLMAISFYHVLASYIVAPDGIATFFILACIYGYIKFDKIGNVKWFIASILFFTLGMLVKYVVIGVIPTIFIYEAVLKFKNIKRAIIFSISGIALFSSFIILSILINRPEIFLPSAIWGFKHLTERESFFLKMTFKATYKLIQYGTPLLTFLPILAIFQRQKENKNILVFWVLIFVALFFFIMSRGATERHMMVLIPPLCILSASMITKNGSIVKRDIKLMFFMTLIFLFFNYYLNSFNYTQKPLSFEYFDPTILIKNPDVWYASFSGPLFKISSLSFFLITFFSSLLFLAYLLSKREETKKTLLLLFLGANIAFNLFLMQEMFFTRLGPNYSETMRDMIDYAKRQNFGLIYALHEDFPYYLHGNMNSYNKNMNSSYMVTSKYAMQTLQSEGGIVLWLNLPPTYEGGPLSKTFNEIKMKCFLEKTFYSRNYETGYIFLCKRDIDEVKKRSIK